MDRVCACLGFFMFKERDDICLVQNMIQQYWVGLEALSMRPSFKNCEVFLQSPLPLPGEVTQAQRAGMKR